jgi:hypothetical protein
MLQSLRGICFTSNLGATIMGTANHLNFDALDELVLEVKTIAQNAVNQGTQ